MYQSLMPKVITIKKNKMCTPVARKGTKLTEDSCCPCASLPIAPPQVQTHLVVPLRKA